MSEINQIGGYYDWKKGLCLPADAREARTAPEKPAILQALAEIYFLASLFPISVLAGWDSGLPEGDGPQPAPINPPQAPPTNNSQPTPPLLCGEAGCLIGPQPGRILQGYFSTAEPDHDNLLAFERMAGQSIDIALTFTNLVSGFYFSQQAAETAAARNAILFTKSEPHTGKRRGNDPNDYLESINLGRFDETMRNRGKSLRDYERPVIETFGHEMNIEYMGAEAYVWQGRQNADAFRAAFKRNHDLISEEGFTDPRTGKWIEGAGAKNVTWLLNFDAGYTKHLDEFIPENPKDPQKQYFHMVGVDGYIRNNRELEIDGNHYRIAHLGGRAVIHLLFDPIIKAIDKNPKLRDKPKLIAEFGINSAGMGMTKERKAELIRAFLDYIVEYNNSKPDGHPGRIVGYVYFDEDKKEGRQQMSWSIKPGPESNAYHKWLDDNKALFQPTALIYPNDDPTHPFPFQGFTVPVPQSVILFEDLPKPQESLPDKSWDEPVKAPLQSVIGEYNRKVGTALLDRWGLEKYVEKEKEKGAKLMAAGIDALSRINPDVPLNYSTTFMDEFQEISALREADRQLPWETALTPFFSDLSAYWENAVTFVSVYAQKAVEEQDREKIEKAAMVCELLIKRFDNQSRIEVKTQLPEKNYAYPSLHNLALLKLVMADARSQLKDLRDYEYREAIEETLDAIKLLKRLEKGAEKILHPTGADYFSISKGLITIGDLNVRLGQQCVLRKDFEGADNHFRAAEKFFAAVGNFDAGRYKGLELEAEPLPGEKFFIYVSVDTMLNSWEWNLSKGYIRQSDKLRGFQGTFHFLKALAAIKIEGAFLENPTKLTDDYKLENLMGRLAGLQHSFEELTRDPEINVDFLSGLAIVIKANILLMIGDRAQYEAGKMDRRTAQQYFIELFNTLSDTVPEFHQAVVQSKKWIADNEKNRLAFIRKDRVPTIDDHMTFNDPQKPFPKTAGVAKRFAFIMAKTADLLAQNVFVMSKPTPATKGQPLFKYLYMLANLLQVDMAVRNFYTSTYPIEDRTNLAKIKEARPYIDPSEDWYRFYSDYLEASIYILRNRPDAAEFAGAIATLEKKVLPETEKFIPPAKVFYQAHVLLLLAEAHILKRNYKTAFAIVNGQIKPLFKEIERLSPSIGWNLKDFNNRYSKAYATSVDMPNAAALYHPWH